MSAGADSPSARQSPIMLRAGARHPDAGPSTSSDEMDMEQVYATLNEYLQMEHKFQPNLCLPNESEVYITTFKWT